MTGKVSWMAHQAARGLTTASSQVAVVLNGFQELTERVPVP